jgi:hypothetical protein
VASADCQRPNQYEDEPPAMPLTSHSFLLSCGSSLPSPCPMPQTTQQDWANAAERRQVSGDWSERDAETHLEFTRGDPLPKQASKTRIGWTGRAAIQ